MARPYSGDYNEIDRLQVEDLGVKILELNDRLDEMRRQIQELKEDQRMLQNYRIEHERLKQEHIALLRLRLDEFLKSRPSLESLPGPGYQ